jgi:hypothetical protein
MKHNVEPVVTCSGSSYDVAKCDNKCQTALNGDLHNTGMAVPG